MKLYQNTILLVYLASSFYIDDTDHFKFLNITAAPSSFGFSIAKGLEIFPNYSYPRCEHKLELGRISMDFDKNNLHMDCKYPNQPYYVLGPDKQVTIATPLQSLNFLKPKSLQNGCEKIEEFHEFAIGACQNQSITDLLYLNPRFNKTAYYQALKRSKKIHQKPMLILYLVPDSFSRRHFYRKLNSTISYFTHLSQNSDYKVYDFKLHNIIGADTSGNMMRIFGDKWVKSFEGDQDVDHFAEKAIWNIMKRLGFVTLWGADSCPTNIPKSMGRSPNVDHCVSSFYCALYEYGDYIAAKSNKKQRCIGSHMSHHYLMEYSKTFNKNYQYANQWIYNHFDAAHEATGQHAQTLDLDLQEYIEYYISNVSKTHELVIIVSADHGMRYGSFLIDPNSIQEHRLPAQFVIARKGFLETFDENLSHNTFRLNSKPDLRETMIYLANYQNGIEYTPTSFYSLFSQKIPDSRTCKDADIPLWYCSSHLPQPLDPRIYDKYLDTNHSKTYFESELSRTIDLIFDNLMFQINSQVYTAKNARAGFLCEKIRLDQIEAASYGKIDENVHIFKLMFRILQSKRARFDTWCLISETDDLDKNMDPEDVYITPIVFMAKKMYLKVTPYIDFDNN